MIHSRKTRVYLFAVHIVIKETSVVKVYVLQKCNFFVKNAENIKSFDDL